ncbi:MAG: hypothetical protein ACKOFW_12000, partial [Planctomycetaceae bacterium]
MTRIDRATRCPSAHAASARANPSGRAGEWRSTFRRLCVAAALLAGVAWGVPARAQSATTVYRGGDILTMRGKTPETVEQLVVRDGKIVFAGGAAEATKQAGPNPRVVDLAGKTLLPGFIDTHGHMVYFGKNLIDANL